MTSRSERDSLLNERQTTHGDFTANAILAQRLRYLFREGTFTMGAPVGTSWDSMHPRHQEALDMIATKLSRILSGQANFKDHWDDIAGYAKLAAEVCDQ